MQHFPSIDHFRVQQRDARKLLDVGPMVQSREALKDFLATQLVGEDELYELFRTGQTQGDTLVEQVDCAIEAISTRLGGHRDMAESYVIFAAINQLADSVFEALYRKRCLGEDLNPVHVPPEMEREIAQLCRKTDHKIMQLQQTVAEMAGYQPQMAKLVVGAYVSNIKQCLGLSKTLDR